MKRLAVCLVLSSAACDGFGDGRVARLEQELRELRAQYVQQKPEVGEALAPLRGAIEALVSRHDLQRARFDAVTEELGRMGELMSSFVDAERRAALDALRQRIAELEQQSRRQAGAQAEERELLLKALEATATKLEAFVRQAQGRAAAAPAVRKSEFDWLSLWPLLAAVAAVGAIAAVLGLRRRTADVVIEEAPEVVVDAPAPLQEPLFASPRGPVPLRVELGATQSGVETRLRQWLSSDPRVLKAPAPELEVRGQSVHVRFFVQHGLSQAERSSLLAEVQLRGVADGSRRSA